MLCDGVKACITNNSTLAPSWLSKPVLVSWEFGNTVVAAVSKEYKYLNLASRLFLHFCSDKHVGARQAFLCKEPPPFIGFRNIHCTGIEAHSNLLERINTRG